MSPTAIAVVVLMVALAGGILWYAMSAKTPDPNAPSQGVLDAKAKADADRAAGLPSTGDELAAQAAQRVLAGQQAPPANNDPRRDAGGGCIAPWHGVTQWDLSTHCDLDTSQWTVDPSGYPWAHAKAGTDAARGPVVVSRDPSDSTPSTFVFR